MSRSKLRLARVVYCTGRPRSIYYMELRPVDSDAQVLPRQLARTSEATAGDGAASEIIKRRTTTRHTPQPTMGMSALENGLAFGMLTTGSLNTLSTKMVRSCCSRSENLPSPAAATTRSAQHRRAAADLLLAAGGRVRAGGGRGRHRALLRPPLLPGEACAPAARRCCSPARRSRARR